MQVRCRTLCRQDTINKSPAIVCLTALFAIRYFRVRACRTLQLCDWISDYLLVICSFVSIANILVLCRSLPLLACLGSSIPTLFLCISPNIMEVLLRQFH